MRDPAPCAADMNTHACCATKWHQCIVTLITPVLGRRVVSGCCLVQTTSKKNDQNRWLIRHAYFQPREGARVSLYSDSHHDPGNSPTCCPKGLLNVAVCLATGCHRTVPRGY